MLLKNGFAGRVHVYIYLTNKVVIDSRQQDEWLTNQSELACTCCWSRGWTSLLWKLDASAHD